MAVKNKKTTVPSKAKSSVSKPTQLKQVSVTAKALPKQDSVSVGYGAGKRTFAKADIKQAVKAGTLKADTTNHRAMVKSLGGNGDKADSINLAIATAKKKKK